MTWVGYTNSLFSWSTRHQNFPVYRQDSLIWLQNMKWLSQLKIHEWIRCRELNFLQHTMYDKLFCSKCILKVNCSLFCIHLNCRFQYLFLSGFFFSPRPITICQKTSFVYISIGNRKWMSFLPHFKDQLCPCYQWKMILCNFHC